MAVTDVFSGIRKREAEVVGVDFTIKPRGDGDFHFLVIDLAKKMFKETLDGPFLRLFLGAEEISSGECDTNESDHIMLQGLVRKYEGKRKDRT